MIEDEFDLRKMTPEEFEKVPYDVMYWVCQGKNCNCYSRVKTYGDFPFFYWRKEWMPISAGIPRNFLMCAKHYKMWKRLIKSFDEEKVYRKIMKPYAMSLYDFKPSKSR